MGIENKLKHNLKVGAGITLYGIAFATSVLTIKEIREGDFFNAAIYYLSHTVSGIGSKILIGGIMIDHTYRVCNKFKNLSKERRELIMGQLDGFISRENIEYNF